jgi:hypothetical protein
LALVDPAEPGQAMLGALEGEEEPTYHGGFRESDFDRTTEPCG